MNTEFMSYLIPIILWIIVIGSNIAFSFFVVSILFKLFYSSMNKSTLKNGLTVKEKIKVLEHLNWNKIQVEGISLRAAIRLSAESLHYISKYSRVTSKDLIGLFTEENSKPFGMEIEDYVEWMITSYKGMLKK